MTSSAIKLPEASKSFLWLQAIRAARAVIRVIFFILDPHPRSPSPKERGASRIRTCYLSLKEEGQAVKDSLPISQRRGASRKGLVASLPRRGGQAVKDSLSISQRRGASRKGDGGFFYGLLLFCIIVSLATTPLLWRGWGRIVRLLASGSLVFARVVSGGAVGFAGRGAGHWPSAGIRGWW